MEPVSFLSAISDENCPPFNDIEYLKKIHAIDPATAKAHLDEVLSRKISRSKLAAIYDHIQQGRPNQQAIRKGQKNGLHSQVFEALQSPTRTIFPTGIFKKMPHKLVDFDFPLPHAVVKIDEESDQEVRVHAVEIRVPNIWGKHGRWQLLERTQLLSTFFDAIWIFIPAPRTVEHQHFTEALIRSIRVLRLTSVGLVTCLVTPEVMEIVLQPSGPPVIDRRYLFPIDGVNGAQGNRNVPALPHPSTTSN